MRLLEPAGRRVRLTAQASLLVTHTEVLLEAMEQAEAALAQSLNQTTGTLRVAAFQTAVLTLVPPALTQLGQQHPALRVEVIELEPEVALPALIAGDFDIVLGEEYPGHPLPRPRETERRDQLTDELRLVTPTGWSERSLPELASRPFVMEPAGTTAREWATAVCRQAGFEPDDRYTTTDLQIHLRLVEHGLAAALLPELVRRPRPSRRRNPPAPRPPAAADLHSRTAWHNAPSQGPGIHDRPQDQGNPAQAGLRLSGH